MSTAVDERTPLNGGWLTGARQFIRLRLSALTREIDEQPVAYKVAGGASIACSAALLFSVYPAITTHLLPSHGEGPTTRPHPLVVLIPLYPQPWAAEVWAWLLIAGVPVSSAVLAYWSPRGGDAGRIGKFTAFVSLILYVLYFRETYHAGVLILAMLAWVLAALHAREIGDVGAHVDEFRDTVGKGLASLQQVSVAAFYSDFYAVIRGAQRRVLSVERFWTMEEEVWPQLKESECDQSTAGFDAQLRLIRTHSGLCRAIVNSPATEFQFIGPIPEHRNAGEYNEDECKELIALVYTICVLEVARAERLSKIQNDIDQADRSTSSTVRVDRRLRITCSIADVPTWVKLIDSQYWLLLGQTRYNFTRQWYADPATAKVTPGVDRAAIARHTHRVQELENTIRQYDLNARRAYEHVCALMLEVATTLQYQPRMPIGEVLEPLVGKIFGGDPTFRTLIETLQLSPAMSTISKRHVLALFQLFVGLHFRSKPRLDGSSVYGAYRSATLADLWERSA